MKKVKDMNRVLIALIEKFGWGIVEAKENLAKIKIVLVAQPEIKTSVALQAAYVTALNCASRAFDMKVMCILPDDVPLQINWPSCEALKGVVIELGGELVEAELGKDPSLIKVLFGGKIEDENSIQVIANGWQAGINTFFSDKIELDTKIDHPLGGVAAGGLAIFEVFTKVFEFDHFSFIRGKGISLWAPNQIENWFKPEFNGPSISYFPRQIWFSGLGHLGQASIWLIGLYKDFSESGIKCILQDDDVVDESNLYTQVLSNQKDVDKPKTRVCASYLEQRGIQTRILEKRMTINEYKDCEELDIPVLVNGYDNVGARRMIQPSAFDLIIDSGVGSSLDLFDSITQYAFPQIGSKPSEIWLDEYESTNIPNPKFAKIIEEEAGCGKVFSSSIATPFVGCFSAALAISEVLRAYNKGSRLSLGSMQMRSLKNREFHLVKSESWLELFKKDYIDLKNDYESTGN